MRIRIVGAALALVLAVVGAFLLVTYVNQADARAAADAQPAQVYIVKTPIPQGTLGEDVKNYVKVDTVPKRNLEPEYVTDLSQLDGLVASTDLLVGEQLVQPRFINPLTAAQNGNVPIPAGMQQVSVALSIDKVVGGAVNAGDYIGVVATTTANGQSTTQFALTHVLVTKVQGLATSQDGKTASQQSTGATLLVTVALNTHDVERWVWAANGGASLWLTLENDKTSTTGSAAVTSSSFTR